MVKDWETTRSAWLDAVARMQIKAPFCHFKIVCSYRGELQVGQENPGFTVSEYGNCEICGTDSEGDIKRRFDRYWIFSFCRVHAQKLGLIW